MKIDLNYPHAAGAINALTPAPGVTGETDALTEVLLCEPSYLKPIPCCSATRESLRDGFEVRPADAICQHAELTMALLRHGVEVRSLPPQPGLPDLCFTRDSAVMTPWGLLGLNPALPHRRHEVRHVMRYAALADIPVLGKIERGTVEGGDICIARPGLLFVGCSGERTDEEGAQAVAGLFEAAGWQTHIYRFDPHFLHLDTQFCMVSEDMALACTAVLSDAFLATLAEAGIETIDVTYKEAQRLGCNILALGNGRILSSADNKRVNGLLRERGFTVDALDVSQFARCGGGIHCLTMPIDRTPGGGFRF